MEPISVLTEGIPESVGVSSERLARFMEALSTVRDPHSLVLVRRGKIICQAAWAPYRLDERHTLFSLSKSFTSTAIGLAVDEGLLGVDDRVLKYFADDAPDKIDANLDALTIRHLLTMSTGHELDATPRYDETNWARAFLGQKLDHQPGSVFTYNSGATYMLSALVQKLSGHTLLEYLRPRLLDPLGITDATWASNSEGVNVGGWGMAINTLDIAKFGQLYLQEGRWGDTQLIPKSWVAGATRGHVDNSKRSDLLDWQQGYGFQFWRCQHGFYRGDGAFGQYCLVMPEFDAVLALNSGLKDMQPPLDIIWEHLIPALSEGGNNATSTESASSLAEVSSSRSVALTEESIDSAKPETVGPAQWTITLEENPTGYRTLAIDRKDRNTVLSFDAIQLTIGHEDWEDQETTYTSFGNVPLHVRAKGVWLTPNTLRARMIYVGEPFTFDIDLTIAADRVELIGANNVSFMDPPPQTRLAGSSLDLSAPKQT
jgi:CubicO group peptidase (beta-lactamase class C family)